MIHPDSKVEQNSKSAQLTVLNLMNGDIEQDLQGIVELASSISDVSTSFISLIGEDEIWFKARVGSDKPSTPKEDTFCNVTVNSEQILYVRDAREDNRFKNFPAVIGEDNLVFYAGFPLKIGDDFVATLCVIDTKPRDLSDAVLTNLEILAKQAERILELKRHEVELSLKNKDLSHSLEVNKQLVSMVSHDVKGPIGSILTFFQTEKGTNDKDFIIEKILPLMKTSLKGVYDMIDNMLGWTNTLKEKSNAENVSLKPIIDNISNIYASQLSFKNLRLEHDICDSLKVKFNGSSLQFILRNLVGNAIKFSEGGKIKIEAQVEGEEVMLSVVDSGTGISGQRLEKILDRNMKVSTQGTQKEKGSGMGVNFILDLLSKSNSQLIIDSKEGEGTRVSFSIPLSN